MREGSAKPAKHTTSVIVTVPMTMSVTMAVSMSVPAMSMRAVVILMGRVFQGCTIPPSPLSRQPTLSWKMASSALVWVLLKTSKHQHPAGEQNALRLRARKIAGQLNAIDRMLEEDRDCAEILTQLVSARRGIKSLAEKLIHSHMQHCIEGARDQTDAKKKMHGLLTVLERYVE
jgi:DNA-binding FrmR family transcriptional regulator